MPDRRESPESHTPDHGARSRGRSLWRHAWPPAVLFLLALGARGAAYVLLDIQYVGGGDNDYASYLVMARAVLRGQWDDAVSYHYPPLYPVFLALTDALSVGMEEGGRVLGVLMGAAHVAPVWFLAQAVSSRAGAWVAALSVALFPTLVEYAPHGNAEPAFFPFLFTGILAAWWALQSSSWKRAAIAGGVLGVATLIKFEALGFTFVLAGIFVLFAIIDRLRTTGRARSRLMQAGALLAVFFLFYGPYISGYIITTGRFSLNPKGEFLYMVYHGGYMRFMYVPFQDEEGNLFTNFERAKKGLKDPLEKKIRASELIRRYPEDMAARLQENIAEAVTASAPSIITTYAPVFWALLPVAVVRRRWTAATFERTAFIIILTCVVALTIAVFDPRPRHFLTLAPMLALWAGLGAARIGDWTAAWPRRRRVIMWSVLIAAVSIPMLVHTARLQPFRLAPVEEALMGKWIHANIDGDPLLIGGGRVTSYYADKPGLALPIAPKPVLWEYCRQKNAGYVIFSERLMRSRQPSLLPYILGPYDDPPLTFVHSVRDGERGYRVALYKFDTSALP